VSGDEQRLIAECLKGRTAAFGDLVGRYQDRLFNTVFRFLDSPEDAQDVVQEAFLNAYQNLRSFKGDSLFYTWLYRIAINTAISWKRKHRPRLHPTTVGQDVVDAAESNRPEHALERAEEETRIQQALSQLSAEHRAVLILKDIEGQRYEEMAEALGVPVGTIRSRLHRARLELREILVREKENS